jgi:hypothetical protein
LFLENGHRRWGFKLVSVTTFNYVCVSSPIFLFRSSQYYGPQRGSQKRKESVSCLDPGNLNVSMLLKWWWELETRK